MLVIKNHEAVAILEIKLDLGWLRNPKQYTHQLIKKYKLPKKVSYKIGEEGNSISVPISKNLSEILLVVTIANDHRRYAGVKEIFEKKGFTVVNLLNDPHHPNKKGFGWLR